MKLHRQDKKIFRIYFGCDNEKFNKTILRFVSQFIKKIEFENEVKRSVGKQNCTQIQIKIGSSGINN